MDMRKKSKILRHTLKMEEFDFHDRHGGGGDVEGLRGLLRHKFGNAARGWRMVIAPHGDHECHDYGRAGTKVTLYSDFCKGLKTIGFSGNGKTCWNLLSKGTNVAWLEDLDPKLGASLDAVAGGIAEHYSGGTHEAWNDIQREHAARATADEFDQFLFDHELLGKNPDAVRTRQVFECLAISGRGNLTREEMRFLDHWATRRLGFRLPDVPPDIKPEPVHWSPPPPKPPYIPDLKDFRTHLEQRFGSPARAWRVALDIKAGGSMSPSEFGMACRQMGWHHPHMVLWIELVNEGGGTANLRGLDPDTCTAIDTLIERMLPAFGDLQTFWSEVLDPDGDGICSRSEWVKSVVHEIGLHSQAAALIFTALDVVHSGWVAYSELGFLEDFIPGAADAEEMDFTLDPRMGMLTSMSTGSLQARDSLQDLSWASSSLEGGSGSGGMQRSRATASTQDLHIGSTQRSSRAMQNRQYANCHMAKYRWMGTAAAAHTRSMSEGSAWATLKREVEPKMPTVGGTPLSDVFRFTNEFYREGCRRLQYHHEMQQGKQKSPHSSSPASSQRSPFSGSKGSRS